MDISLIEEIKNLNQSVVKSLFRKNKIKKKALPPRPLQMAVLEYVIEHEDEDVCQKDLENNFKISKSAISDVIKTMEKNNLIVRTSSETDARKNIIIPTKDSINIYKDLKNDVNEVNKELLNCLTKDEVDEFIRIIEKLKKHMKEGI